MLIRSINGETPEGAVPVEDRAPHRSWHIVSLQQCAGWGGWDGTLGRDPSSKILFIEFYSNVPDGHSEAIQYEVLYKYRTAVRYLLIENYLTAVF